MASKSELPSSKKLVWPVIQFLKSSSGPMQKATICSQVSLDLNLSSELTSLRHDNSRTEFQYRVAWALSYGKKSGYFENPDRNHWVITEKGRRIGVVTEVVL